MAVEISTAQRRMFFQPISWAAIFAALAVGIAVQMLLMLLGLAFGASVVEPVETSAREVSLSATTWSTGSMIIAAFIGGYVASRSSGLRRKGDGMLHGAVAWAATTLLYAVLASTVLGQATAGVFGALRPLVVSSLPATGEIAQSAQSGEQARAEVQRSLESAGLTSEQALNIVDQMAAVSGDPQASPESQARAEEAADRVGTATGWLSAAVLLSLLAGVLGGLVGTVAQRRVTTRQADYGDGRVLSRTTI
ncbi:MAG TPA: hypothetical protein VJU83_07965 [Burkholderiales bacterium]|nr:hypothetical protein [Burkholderiales bacterium]